MTFPKSLVLLACVSLVLAAIPAAAESDQPWWHRYSTIATDPEKKSLDELRTVDADCWRAAGWYAGWYGFWFGDVLENHTDVPLRWQKVIDAGSRPMMYLDAGEVGDFATLIDEPNRQFLLNGWNWHEWQGAPGTVHWFGLQTFMENPNWAPYKTAEDYGLSPFTYPDGRAIREGELYEVLAQRDHQNQWRMSYFTNPQVTDELAQRTGLADLSLRQELPPEVQQGSGWAIGRLLNQDHANPQLADFQAHEMEYAIRRFQPGGVHVDNFGDVDIWGISGSFGMWSIHTHRTFLKEHFTRDQLLELGVDDVDRFDIREYVASAYREEGIDDNERLRDPRWYSDTLFRTHLINKIETGIAYARGLYEAGTQTMAEEGLDGPIFGNVLPLLPSGGFMEGLCDIVHFEWKSVGAYFGMPELGLPPDARLAYVTRLGEKLSNASYCWPSIYVPQQYSGADYEALHKVIAFEALANRGVMDYNHWYLDNYSPGTDESAGYVNRFIKAVAPALTGRNYYADVALVYCPWSNVASIDAMAIRPDVFLNEYKGWCDYLCNSHTQWDVFLSAHLSHRELKEYKVVILPSMLAVTEEQVEEMERYLDDGGMIIATGDSGVYADPKGYLLPHEENPLDRLSGRNGFMRTTNMPGAEYFDSDCGAEAGEVLRALLDQADYEPVLATDAPRHIGVNASLLRERDKVSLTLDLNNNHYDIENDAVHSAESVSISVRLPKELQHTSLHINYADPDFVEETVWRPYPEQQYELVENGQVLKLTTPPLRYFITVRIEASGADSPVRFTDVTKAAGLSHTGPSFAVAAADYDKDGWVDLAISNHGYVTLHRNMGDGTFSDVTEQSDFERGIDTHGATWVDWNMDGYLDLFVACGGNRGMGNGNPNRLYLNNGEGRFIKADLPIFVQDAEAGSRFACPADIDRDGRLDLVLMNFVRPDNGQHVALRTKDGWRDIASDMQWTQRGATSLRFTRLQPGAQPLLLCQTAGAEAGALFDYEMGEPVRELTSERGLQAGYEVQSVVPFDYDNDGDLDLYYVYGPNWVSASPVVRDGVLYFFYEAETDAEPKRLRFECTEEMMVECHINGLARNSDIRLGAGLVRPESNDVLLAHDDPRLAGVPETDPETDLGVYLYSPEPGIVELLFLNAPSTPYAAMSGKIAVGNTLRLLHPAGAKERDFPDVLYQNQGTHFVEVTEAAGLMELGKGSDAVAADFDNDGHVDLYVINGGDRYENLPNTLYRNKGDGTFEDITTAVGLDGPRSGRADAVVAFDYDNDGRMDLLVLNGGGPAPVNQQGPRVFWRNDTPGGNWLKVDLIGSDDNPFAMGAGVVVEANGTKSYQERSAATGRFAGSVIPLHFGLGEAEKAKVTVYWPDGKTRRVTAEAGKTLTVRRNDTQ